ncbi:MAG: hypothetical protein QOI38_296 [Sphingomonadales bacterium]|jgi:hypothetical protein|nr:hypothetical protein [Sphingomonadales bacterium]
MTRSIDQILTDERIEIAPPLIRTPDLTLEVGDGWMLSVNDWAPVTWPNLHDLPSPLAVTALIASAWLLVRPVPPDMPWLTPVAFAIAIGALWSIGGSLLRRWVRPAYPPQPRYALLFGGWSEGAVTIFKSDDDQEIKLLRQKLEAMLLPNAVNGE